MSYEISESDELDLPEIIYEEPEGYETVGFWCWRGGGHLTDTACKSDSVPLIVQTGWAVHVRRAIENNS